MQNLTVKDSEGYGYSYSQLCALVIDGGCWNNEILGLSKHMPEIESGGMSVTFPIWFDPDTFHRYTFAFFTGGLEVDPEEGTIQHIKFVALNYFLTSTTKDDIKMYA